MKSFIKLLLMTMILGLLATGCELKRPQIDESIEKDSIELQEYQYVPTVADVLEERENLRYSLWVDSVYLSMPTEILTHMLVTKGTTMSMLEIVEDYWQNKKFYHDTILKSMKIQKKYFPDSVPKSSINSIPTSKTDSSAAIHLDN